MRSEFNFTTYVNELKDRVKEYIKNFSQRPQYSQEDNYYAEQGNERYGRRGDVSVYNENSHFQQGGRGKKRGGRGDKRGDTRSEYGYNNNEYYPQNVQQDNYAGGNYYQDDYNNQDAYSRQSKRGGKKNNNRRGQEEYDQYSQFDQNTHYNQDSQFGQYTQHGGQYDQYEQSSQAQSQQKLKQGGRKGQPERKPVEQPNLNKFAEVNRPPVKIDYSFIFNSFGKIVKEYIVNKIKNENPREEDFIVPSETLYQLIIIVDRLENDKMRELTSITNFGFDLDVFRELKKIMTEANFEPSNIYRVLDKLEIKQLLILYKYCTTAAKKTDGLFYKLGNL
jgi:hypothetical protein